MKRNVDLIRTLLFETEKNHDGSGRIVGIETDNNSPEVVEHLFLLKEAGLIEGQDVSQLGGRDFLVQRMTWNGHDFLDTVRDPEIWKKTMERAEIANSFNFDLLWALGNGLIGI